MELIMQYLMHNKLFLFITITWLFLMWCERASLIGIRYYQWKFGEMNADYAKYLAKEYRYIANYNEMMLGKDRSTKQLHNKANLLMEYAKLLEV